jgi:uncharacterized RDD family membrane protein YckC
MNDQNPYSAPESSIVNSNSDEIELATRGERFGGAIVDVVVAIVTTLPILFFFTDFWQKALAGEQVPMQDTLMLNVFSACIFFVINGYLLASNGQTIGKRVVGIKIVSIHDHQILPFWKVVLLRYIPRTVLELIPNAIISFILSLINILFIFREDRRCIHDHIAGTIVIKAK